MCYVGCGIKIRKLKVHVCDSGTPSENVTSRWYNWSLIIPRRLAYKTLERFSFAFTANGKRQTGACLKSKKIIIF